MDNEFSGKPFKLGARKTVTQLLCSSIIALSLFWLTCKERKPEDTYAFTSGTPKRCPAMPALRPKSYTRDNSTIEMIVRDEAFRTEAIAKLLGAVGVKTESFDSHLCPSQYPESYSSFLDFHQYLKDAYPIAHEKMQLEHPKYDYNLLYTWNGSNQTLKPLVLAAHQDVVPVNPDTLSEWNHDPFKGFSDGTFLYGRGVSDCKSLLTSLLKAVELLSQDGFTPSRTIILAFGFDEEVGGRYGAGELGKFLLDRYGSNGIYAIVDEGGAAIEKIGDTFFALPAVGEKGSFSSQIELYTPGGHSSVPPDHTGIGIMSELVTLIESSPFQSKVYEENPFYSYLQCMAEFATRDESIPCGDIKHMFKDVGAEERVLKWVDSHRNLKYLAKTTQAADIIKGGIKANALPELTQVTVNHRVNVGSSCNVTAMKILRDIQKVASSYDIGLVFNGLGIHEPTQNGYFNYTAMGFLEPAPVSPVVGPVWSTFSGTIRHVFEDVVFAGKPDTQVVVAPSITTGNTDTAHYWDLSENIYRYKFATFNSVLDGHAHSVNEKMPIDSYLYLIAFNYEYILNSNEESRSG
ncbi:LAMI_0G14532g1_1 [Lachancea mirantina]|uniref:LAMI_0G14532g1_1 n=1 Tax=Lachancea mirantina TaxID=1230905 RepID=A0A1G4KC61_9SACH|nr:LAMI_0G14532g1_1 [Lachancea mirantina]